MKYTKYVSSHLQEWLSASSHYHYISSSDQALVYI